MKVIEDTTIEDVIEHDGQQFVDLEFNRCTFRGAALIARQLSLTDPSRRATIRNVQLNDCISHSASLDGAIVEDVRIHNLKRVHMPLFLRANAYKHVKLSGKIAAVEIRGKIGVFDDSHDDLWDSANRAYYHSVDWAIDISDARFASFSISGVPTCLVKRDLEITAVVTRERALEGTWRELAYNSGLFSVVISALIEEGYDDTLLIACRGSSRFKDQLEDLDMLRKERVAT